MDDIRRKRAVASLGNEFAPSYDPVEDLDPAVGHKIRQMAPDARPGAVEAAYDDAGVYAKLKRMLKGAYNGDIYKKN